MLGNILKSEDEEWMELEMIILRETAQPQKDKHSTLALNCRY